MKRFLVLISLVALVVGTALVGTASAHQSSTGDPYAHYPDLNHATGIVNGEILYAHASGLNEPGAVLSAAVFCSSNSNILPQDGRQCDIPDLSGLAAVAAETWARVRVVQGQLNASALGLAADPRAVCPPSAADQLAGISCGVAVSSVTGALAPVSFGFRPVFFTGLKQLAQVDGGLVQKFKAPTIKAAGGTAIVKYQIQNSGATTINLSGAIGAYTGAANHDALSPVPATRGLTMTVQKLSAHKLKVDSLASDTLAVDDNADGANDALPAGWANNTIIVIKGAAFGGLVLSGTYALRDVSGTTFKLASSTDSDTVTPGFQAGPAINITSGATSGATSKTTARGGESWSTVDLGVSGWNCTDTTAPPATLLVKKKFTGIKTCTATASQVGTLYRFSFKLVVTGTNPNPCTATPPDTVTPLPPCDLADSDFGNNQVQGSTEAK